MESYKHSCPFCGQHIEYTLEYCGTQLECPSCTKTVAFPAIPPGLGKGKTHARVKELDAKRAAANARKNWLERAANALGILRNFQHWETVWQCVVPFLVIGLLLGGAMFVKKKFGAASAPVEAPAVQADPEAWQRIADLAKADRTVRMLMKEYNVDQARLAAVEAARKQEQKGDSSQKQFIEEQVQQAQLTLSAAHKRLDAAMEKYRQLGGNVDYRSQMRNY
ncbi:MAG TPA: hypothetical protein VK731_11720 [Candidatus Cybelea sp.]|jgi:hypothetical protein|nr:hypothetical protein [Candidatus Cybelea sp.]